MRDHTKPTKTTKNIFCAHCGTQNPTDGYACSRCGERLTNSTTNRSSQIEYVPCSECRNTNDGRSDYCWVCGAEMSQSIPLTSTPNTETPATAQNRIVNRTVTSSTDLIQPASDLTSAEQALKTRTQEHILSSEEEIAAQNTSGKADGKIPSSIKRWNWAAFLYPQVWGLFSGVPFATLLFAVAFLPSTVKFLILLGASLFLGFKGNELAWRGKKWRSVEHFNSFQQQWTSWSIKITAGIIAILIIAALNGWLTPPPGGA